MVVAALAGFVALAVLVMLATAATVWLVKVRPALERDPDTQFWYGFAGLSVLLPAILITAGLNRWAGAALALLSAATWWWSNKWVARRMALRAEAATRTLADVERAALFARHNAVLSRWSRYELDPAAAIDFPAMADVRIPETSALVKAIALADLLRRSPVPAPEGATDYRTAISGLEDAFRVAEEAALERSRG